MEINIFCELEEKINQLENDVLFYKNDVLFYKKLTSSLLKQNDMLYQMTGIKQPKQQQEPGRVIQFHQNAITS